MTKLITNAPGFTIANPKMIELYEKVSDFARMGESCIFFGPSGTGKEFLAKYYSQIWKKNKYETILKSVNCSCFTEELAMSELFGHEKGAFTGAIKEHIGYFEQLNKISGVIFLDEFADIPIGVQPMLLRALDREGRKSLQRLGSANSYSAENVKVIAATELSSEKIRPSILNRIGFQIQVPTLNQRPEDVPYAIPYFINQILINRIDREEIFKNIFGYSNADFNKMTDNDFLWDRNQQLIENYVSLLELITKDILEKVLGRIWPGNFRSLFKAINYGLVRSRDFSTPNELRKQFIKYFNQGISDFSYKGSENDRIKARQNMDRLNSIYEKDPMLIRSLQILQSIFPKMKSLKKEKMAIFLLENRENEFTSKELLCHVNTGSKRSIELNLNSLRDNNIVFENGQSSNKYYRINEQIFEELTPKHSKNSLFALPIIENHEPRKDRVEDIVKALETNKGVYISGMPRSGKTTLAIDAGRTLAELGSEVFYFNIEHNSGLDDFIKILRQEIKNKGITIAEAPMESEKLKKITDTALMAGYLTQIMDITKKSILILDHVHRIKSEFMLQELSVILSLWTTCQFILVGRKKEIRPEFDNLVEIEV